MTTWFTSDLHFGHERIIELCNRPFRNVKWMDMELERRWNSVVSPEDEVYVLGDLALGKLNDSLQHAAMLVGRKFLVPGNHDRMWSGLKKVQPEKVRWYEDAGFVILSEQPTFWANSLDKPLLLCHFPYAGDSQETDRHFEHRPKDNGLWLLHGHTHWPRVFSDHPRQIHVGVDAWNYQPVSLHRILEIIKEKEEKLEHWNS